MYRRIMLTLDGSELARAAIPHVEALAKAFDAEVVLFEAIPELRGPAAFGIEGERTRDRRAALSDLSDAKDEIQRAGVTDVTVEVREGDAGKTILGAADDLDCDVIVIAGHGRSGVRRAVMGSVAEHVARHSVSPVFLVPARPAPIPIADQKPRP
jgi:nucleotide-binding universal stress UspA family protein